MSVSRWALNSSVTRAGGVWPNGAAVSKPVGVDLSGVQLSASDAGGAFAGTTLSAKLQGSIDGSGWIDVFDGGGVTFTANGSAMLGGSDQVIGLGQFVYLRLIVSEAGGAPVNGLAVTAWFNAEFDTGVQV